MLEYKMLAVFAVFFLLIHRHFVRFFYGFVIGQHGQTGAFFAWITSFFMFFAALIFTFYYAWIFDRGAYPQPVSFPMETLVLFLGLWSCLRWLLRARLAFFHMLGVNATPSAPFVKRYFA